MTLFVCPHSVVKHVGRWQRNEKLHKRMSDNRMSDNRMNLGAGFARN